MTYCRSQNLRRMIKESYSIPEDTFSLSTAQKKTLKENILRDAQTLFALQQKMVDNIFPRIMGVSTVKEAWTTLNDEFDGS